MLPKLPEHKVLPQTNISAVSGRVARKIGPTPDDKVLDLEVRLIPQPGRTAFPEAVYQEVCVKKTGHFDPATIFGDDLNGVKKRLAAYGLDIGTYDAKTKLGNLNLSSAEPIDPAKIDEIFGVDDDFLASAKKKFADYGFEVGDYDQPNRLLKLKITAGKLRVLAKTELDEFEFTDPLTGQKRIFTDRMGAMQLPEDLHILVQGFYGVDARQKFMCLFQKLLDAQKAAAKRRKVYGSTKRRPAAKSKKPQARNSFSPIEAALRYNAPGLDKQTGNFGKGASGCFISLSGNGGGFNPAIINEYNAKQGLPNASWIFEFVDGASNNPNPDPNGSTVEDYLDAEQLSAAALALLLCVIAQNSTTSFAKAITTAVKHANRPRVITISWGQFQSGWAQQDFDLMEDAMAIARSAGVTIFVAAGDDDVTDRNPRGGVETDYPSCSQKAVSVAGVFDPGKANYAGVTAWNRERATDIPPHGGTGGGVDDASTDSRFALSPWQQKLVDAGFKMPVRVDNGKPGKVNGDVAYIGDPFCGIRVMLPDGQDGKGRKIVVIGGTSAGAPGMGAIFLLIWATVGRSFDFLDEVYSALAEDKVGVCVPVTVGDNSTLTEKGYKAGDPQKEFSAPCGLGMVQADKLVLRLMRGGKSTDPTGEKRAA